MSFQAPNCIILLAAISQQMEKHQTLFQPGRPAFNILKKTFQNPGNFEDDPNLTESPACITYLQLLFLLGLTMHGGILIPNLSQITIKKNTLSLMWDTGISDIIKLGVMDHNFVNFASSFYTKILGAPKPFKNFTLNDIQLILKKLHTYTEILNITDKRISLISKNIHSLPDLIKQGVNQDLLFSILSSVPTDELNAFFLNLHQHLPEDLTVKSETGMIVKLSSLFQAPTSSAKTLMERLMIYFQLYFGEKTPIIKEITRLKTTDFIVEIMKTAHVKTAILANLKNLLENQIKTRLKLYYIFTKHLELVLKKNGK